MGALLTYYYNQQNQINTQVKTLHLEAEKAALDGKYAEALGLLDKAPRSKTECKCARSGSSNYRASEQSIKTNGRIGQFAQNRQAVRGRQNHSNGDKNIKRTQEPVFNKARAALNNRKVTLAVLKVKRKLIS